MTEWRSRMKRPPQAEINLNAPTVRVEGQATRETGWPTRCLVSQRCDRGQWPHTDVEASPVLVGVVHDFRSYLVTARKNAAVADPVCRAMSMSSCSALIWRSAYCKLACHAPEGASVKIAALDDGVPERHRGRAPCGQIPRRFRQEWVTHSAGGWEGPTVQSCTCGPPPMGIPPGSVR
jgi:hypothetical protein